MDVADEVLADLMRRLRKIEGQVRGIHRCSLINGTVVMS